MCKFDYDAYNNNIEQLAKEFEKIKQNEDMIKQRAKKKLHDHIESFMILSLVCGIITLVIGLNLKYTEFNQFGIVSLKVYAIEFVLIVLYFSLLKFYIYLEKKKENEKV